MVMIVGFKVKRSNGSASLRGVYIATIILWIQNTIERLDPSD
jgi:hypothetical protein